MCTTLLLGVSGNFTNCSTWYILSSRCESFGVIADVRPGNRRSLMVMEEVSRGGGAESSGAQDTGIARWSPTRDSRKCSTWNIICLAEGAGPGTSGAKMFHVEHFPGARALLRRAARLTRLSLEQPSFSSSLPQSPTSRCATESASCAAPLQYCTAFPRKNGLQP
jgi:hypothetical protein